MIIFDDRDPPFFFFFLPSLVLFFLTILDIPVILTLFIKKFISFFNDIDFKKIKIDRSKI